MERDATQPKGVSVMGVIEKGSKLYSAEGNAEVMSVQYFS